MKIRKSELYALWCVVHNADEVPDSLTDEQVYAACFMALGRERIIEYVYGSSILEHA